MDSNKNIKSLLNIIFSGAVTLFSLIFFIMQLPYVIRNLSNQQTVFIVIVITFEIAFLVSFLLIGFSFLTKFLKKDKLLTKRLQLSGSILCIISIIIAYLLFCYGNAEKKYYAIFIFLILFSSIGVLITTLLENKGVKKPSNVGDNPTSDENSLIDEKNLKTYVRKKGGKDMIYTHLEVRPKDFEKKVNAMAANGWRVVAQSESTWTIRKCFGFSNTVDSIINVTLEKDA